MGQYYKIAYKLDDGVIYTNNREVEGVDYVGAKLMEHSYFGNCVLDAVADLLEHRKTRILWVGDYADEDNEVENITNGDLKYTDVWGDNQKNKVLFNSVKFKYSGKYLVNHSKNVYISFDRYLNALNNDEWSINPISILTCIGNGRGGGDYAGTNMDYVGSWGWDELEITNEQPTDMKLLDVTFAE